MTSEKKSLLLSQLQEAIDEAVSESGRVGEIIEEMRSFGFDMCLMLESTVTITPTGERRHDGAPQPPLATCKKLAGDVGLTVEDLEFLQELKIAA